MTEYKTTDSPWSSFENEPVARKLNLNNQKVFNGGFEIKEDAQQKNLIAGVFDEYE